MQSPTTSALGLGMQHHAWLQNLYLAAPFSPGYMNERLGSTALACSAPQALGPPSDSAPVASLELLEAEATEAGKELEKLDTGLTEGNLLPPTSTGTKVNDSFLPTVSEELGAGLFVQHFFCMGVCTCIQK